MENYSTNSYNKIKRGAKYGHYDKETIHSILDATFLCHIAYVWEGRPIVIPTAYGRKGEHLYIHGAIANRMMKGLMESKQASITVTLLDGLVLARSAFHHSANYRSVALFGKVEVVNNSDEKMEALKIIMEQMLPGRWEEVRIPTESELKATLVLDIEVEYASAKVRSGDPVDDEQDYDLEIWAGTLPIIQSYETPINDKLLKYSLDAPRSVRQKIEE